MFLQSLYILNGFFERPSPQQVYSSLKNFLLLFPSNVTSQNGSRKEVNRRTNHNYSPKERHNIQNEATKQSNKHELRLDGMYAPPRKPETRGNPNQRAYTNHAVAVVTGNDSTSADSWKLLDHVRFPKNIATRYNARVYSSSSSNYSPLSSYTSPETEATYPLPTRSFLPRLHKNEPYQSSVYAGRGGGYYYQNQYYGAVRKAPVNNNYNYMR